MGRAETPLPREPGASLTYLYCVLGSKAPPRLPPVPKGIPGAGPPRLVPAGDGLWLVAASVPLADYGPEAIERGLADLRWVSDRGLAHEAVVEAFHSTGVAVPMKLFTLFHNDERAANHIERDAPRIRRALDHVRGCAEWSVRIARAASPARDDGPGVGPGRPASGTGFLLAKKGRLDAAKARSREGRERAQQAFEELGRLARDSRTLPLPPAAGPQLLLDAVFLVPARGTARFDQAARRIAARFAELGYRVSLNGPWPAYNFIA